MAQVTAKMVKELRDMTGVGMMDAKRALVEVDGDMDQAVDYLRENGMAKAAKKAAKGQPEEEPKKAGRPAKEASSDDDLVGADDGDWEEEEIIDIDEHPARLLTREFRTE